MRIKVTLLLLILGMRMSATTPFWFRYSSKQLDIKEDTLQLGIVNPNNGKRAHFIYDVDFYTYFDNREYHEPYQIPQTIFNFRLSPTIGVQIEDMLGGKHRLIAGVNYTQPLGGGWKNVQFNPIAYYHYKYKGLNMQFGAVPYDNRVMRLPNLLQYDSLAYYRPNIQGALISYEDQRGFVEFMCDWRGSQTPEIREMFRLMIDGRYKYKWFFVGGIGQINHKANFKAPTPREGICDDTYVIPQIGFDLTGIVPEIDTFSMRFSYVLGIQNHRSIESYQKPQGFMAELMFNWWFLGIRDEFYVGDSMMPHYRYYRSDLNQGDPFYQSRIYNRLDIFAYLYRNSFVNCYLSYNLHYDGVSLAHQQQLIVRFNLGSYGTSKNYLKNMLW